MKNKRQERILQLIRDKDIGTQEQLLQELSESGFQTTQATISRDIKQLRLVKRVGTGGIVRYELPTEDKTPQFNDRLDAIFQQCMIQCNSAQNIVVIKTLPGLASAACSAIDGMGVESVVGTLAGDDTAFLVMKDNISAASFCNEIRLHMQK